MNSKMIKVIGMAATLIGIGVNLITDWVDDQKMDEKIDKTLLLQRSMIMRDSLIRLVVIMKRI